MYFDIDISNINVVTDRQELTPDIYTHRKNSQRPTTISLKNGKFLDNAYYTLISYDTKNRKKEYNFVNYTFFTVPSKTAKFICPYTAETQDQFAHVYPNDIHIQETVITGNAKSGFTIHTSPMSESAFELVEVDE